MFRLFKFKDAKRKFQRSVTINQKSSPVLPIISYQSTKLESNEKIFYALKNHNGFIMSDLPPQFNSSAYGLINSYESFLKQPNETKNAFIGKFDNNLQGFYPYGNFLLGSKTCDRFFINR